MADDQGWGDMAYNGHPVLKTPHFDDMASSALRFDRFYAAAPVCSPTRGSVLTGRHPNRFGCFQWGYSLRPQEVTIAEALKTAGYVTGHFGKWHLGSVHRGSPVNPGASGFDEWFSAPNFYDNDPILSREGIAVQTEGESSRVTADAAINFMRRHASSERPFFAVVWFGSPHLPHQATDTYREMYRDQPEKLQHFYGEITGMDEAFGMIRSELTTLGIKDNTLLWYCSDNGGLPEVSTTGGRGHKGQIYEGGLRVPAMIEWPARLKSHTLTNVPCNTCDIYPTLLDITGVTIPDQSPLDGISLMPLVDGDMTSRSRPMGFWNYPAKGVPTYAHEWMKKLMEDQRRGNITGDIERLCLNAAEISEKYPLDSFPGHAAYLDWPWKLHRIESVGSVKHELYNLADDPMETTDVIMKHRGKTDALVNALNSWQISVVRSLNGEDYHEKAG